MTITLEAGHTYPLRNGTKATLSDRDPSPDLDYPWNGTITDPDGTTWQDNWTDAGSNWRHTSDNPYDIVEEVLSAAAEPSSPVRQRTVTEIVPGDYERLRVDRGGTEGEVWISVIPRNSLAPTTIVAMNAEELRALAATATQLADALDIIASESQS